MFTLKEIKKFELIANTFIMSISLLVLYGAFILQLFFQELPCPLCILQRIGFVCMLYGSFLNLYFGFQPSHYATIVFSGLFTSFVALRQIVLHIIPGTGEYGEPILGFHLYTWAFIISMFIIILTTALLAVDRQYINTHGKYLTPFWQRIIKLLFILTLIVIAGNIVSTFLECGFFACPDNPTDYRYL